MTCCDETSASFSDEFLDGLKRVARADKRTIVLPEGTDDRILTAAHTILSEDVANLIILGDRDTIETQAQQLGLDLTKAQIQDPQDPALIESFAHQYALLRKEKNLTLDEARTTMNNLSFFATMMIHEGLADGMVSGAVNTTADTIRPALQFIKTKPGVATVSGAFLMCLADRVLVFADCAVTPNPSVDNLVDIAVASADTATAFGIEPRVAMLSYSTGTSGAGPDVDKIVEATTAVRQRKAHLAVEGPIQFDAAIDEQVAKTKLPGSTVAGHATVFIFPDLNSGNITYKAVQRTAQALAIGPILQGLNRPVNDLSRGALVDDIVNTIIITAIQSQGQ
ncbi:MAG: phosphate acetyltransferase [Propionibacteriaceae bacterium]|nr:phosphate acetyltransferase [Propionibacteriaceae bacterium]